VISGPASTAQQTIVSIRAGWTSGTYRLRPSLSSMYPTEVTAPSVVAALALLGLGRFRSAAGPDREAGRGNRPTVIPSRSTASRTRNVIAAREEVGIVR